MLHGVVPAYIASIWNLKEHKGIISASINHLRVQNENNGISRTPYVNNTF
jgi:hypothetical protein